MIAPGSEKFPGRPADQSVEDHKHTRQYKDHCKHADDCAAGKHRTYGLNNVDLRVEGDAECCCEERAAARYD